MNVPNSQSLDTWIFQPKLKSSFQTALSTCLSSKRNRGNSPRAARYEAQPCRIFAAIDASKTPGTPQPLSIATTEPPNSVRLPIAPIWFERSMRCTPGRIELSTANAIERNTLPIATWTTSIASAASSPLGMNPANIGASTNAAGAATTNAPKKTKKLVLTIFESSSGFSSGRANAIWRTRLACIPRSASEK